MAELLTRKQMCEHLGLYTPQGKPHVDLLCEILKDLKIEPADRSRKGFLYHPNMLVEVRRWFGRNYPDDLPVRIAVKKFYFNVIYKPEPDNSIVA